MLTLHHDFQAADTDLEGFVGDPYTCTRAGQALIKDSLGFLRPVYGNEPRFNGAVWNEQLVHFPLSSWATVNTTMVDAGDEGPLPGVTAYRFAGDATNGIHSASQTAVFNGLHTAPGGKWKSKTIYVKEGTARYVGLCRRSYAGQTSRLILFDTRTGDVIATAGNHTDFVSVDAGNGWWRVGTSHSLVEPANGAFFLAAGNSTSKADYEGPVSTEYVLVAGPQAFSDSNKPQTFRPYLAPNGSSDRSDLSGACEGVFEEEAATNLHTESEDVSAWTLTNNATITTFDAQCPDSSDAANLLSDDNSTGTGEVWAEHNVTIGSGVDHVESIFVKADQLDKAILTSAGYDASGNGSTWFDLTGEGAVETQDANHSDAGIERWVIDGVDWYRCYVVMQSTTDLAGSFRVQCAETDNVLTVDLDGTSSIHIWGAQVETGTIPSSLIRTNGSTATRNAEVVVSPNADTWLDTPDFLEGTLYVRYRWLEDDELQNIYSINDGGSGHYITQRQNTDGNLSSAAFAGGAATPLFNIGLGATVGDSIQFASRFETDNCRSSANIVGESGVVTATDGSYTPYDSVLALVIGASFGQSIVSGPMVVEEIRFYTDTFDDDTVDQMAQGNFPDEAFGNTGRRKRANDAALWYHKMRLKQEDEEALKLIRQILG